MTQLLIGRRIDELKQAIGTTHAAQWRRLHEQCDWYRTQHPPAEHPRASITYFGPAAANLALAYRITGFTEYREEAWRWISTAIGFPHWGKAHMPDHDLDAGWLCHGLSLAYSWLRDDLGDERARMLREKLELQGTRLYEYIRRNQGRWWASSFWQNHNWICFTGLATAGYALGSTEWTQAAKENFTTVVDLMAPDGSDCEGVVYWRYGVPWLATYLDLLEDTEGEEWWDDFRFLRNTFRWRLHQCAPGFGENLDHGDCHDRRSGHSLALYYKLAAKYRIGEAQWLAELVRRRHFWREAYASGVKPGVMAEAYLELLWFDPGVAAREPSGDLTAYFPDLGQVTARTGWDDDATLVSFKSGPGGGNGAWDAAERFRTESGWETLNAGHHHPDAGSFVLAAKGAFLAVDDGYSNEKRAANHNLVLVDDNGWADEGRYNVYDGIPHERRPRMRDVLAADGFVHATAETAPMYDPALGVRRLDRTLVVTPAGRMVLLDLLEADEPREWTFLLHSDWPTDLADPTTFTLRSGPARAVVRRFAPAAATVRQTVTAVEANPTASTPSLRITKSLRTVRVGTPATSSAVFLTTIEPGDSAKPPVSTARRLECGDSFGVAFGTDEYVILSPVDRRIAYHDIEAEAAAVVIAADGSDARIATVAANSVTRGGQVLYQSTTPITGRLPGTHPAPGEP